MLWAPDGSSHVDGLAPRQRYKRWRLGPDLCQASRGRREAYEEGRAKAGQLRGRV